MVDGRSSSEHRQPTPLGRPRAAKRQPNDFGPSGPRAAGTGRTGEQGSLRAPEQTGSASNRPFGVGSSIGLFFGSNRSLIHPPGERTPRSWNRPSGRHRHRGIRQPPSGGSNSAREPPPAFGQANAPRHWIHPRAETVSRNADHLRVASAPTGRRPPSGGQQPGKLPSPTGESHGTQTTLGWRAVHWSQTAFGRPAATRQPHEESSTASSSSATFGSRRD